ncbi:MAG: hypothetical protein WC819_04635 [Parcubacteria group bacterium]|jgi:hypothetical protein
MRKFTVLFCAVTMLFSFCSISAAVAGEDSITGSISEDLRTGYLGNGGFMFSNRGVSQTDASLYYKGFRVEAWLSTNFNGEFVENDGGEIDLIAAKNRDYTIWGRSVNLDVGFAYFDCPTLFSSPDTVEFFVEAQLKTATRFTPFARGEFDFTTDDGRNKNTLFLGTLHQWKISDAFTLKSKGAGVFDLGDGTSDSGMILLIETGLDWKLSEKLTFKPIFLKATTPVFGAADREGTEEVLGTNLTYKF